jgi:nucleoside-diphosphate-sugar epimerase
MFNLKYFKHPIYHFGSGMNYSLKDIINFINKNYLDKKIIAGKGFAPWSNDSIIRGPMTSSKKINFYKPKTSMKEGVAKYIKFLTECRNA